MPRNQMADIASLMGIFSGAGGGKGGAIGGYEPFPAGPVLDQGGRKGITYGAPSVPQPTPAPTPGPPVRDDIGPSRGGPPKGFPSPLAGNRPPEYNPLPFDVWVKNNGRQKADHAENMQVYNLYIQTYQDQFAQAMEQYQQAEMARQAKGRDGSDVGQTAQNGEQGPRPRYGPHGEPLQFGYANNVTNIKTWHG